MLTYKKIAVTGGVSCGKSSVCRFLQNCGAYVISSDALVHRLLSPDTKVGQKVIEWFGKECLYKNNQGHLCISRSFLAKEVFQNKDKKQALEEILNPYIKLELEKNFTRFQKRFSSKKLWVVEVPLLFEANLESFFDIILTVTASKETCAKRFPKEKLFFEERWKGQLDLSTKEKKSHLVIVNEGKKTSLKQTVEAIYPFLKKFKTYLGVKIPHESRRHP